MTKKTVADFANLEKLYSDPLDCAIQILTDTVLVFSDKKELNDLFISQEKYIKNNYPEKLIYFYFAAFILTYQKKKVLKNSLWGAVYPFIKAIDTQIATHIATKKIIQLGMNFINFCLLYETQLFFFQDAKLLTDIRYKLLYKSLTCDRKTEQKKYIDLLEFIDKNYPDYTAFDNLEIQNKLNSKKFFHLKIWHIEYNKYIKNLSLMYSFLIDGAPITLPLYDYAAWNTMRSGIEFLIKNQNFEAVGLDGIKYKDLTPFFKSYLKNENVAKYLISHLKKRALKAKSNKAIWVKCILELTLEEKLDNLLKSSKI